jgi:hypothetical protein
MDLDRHIRPQLQRVLSAFCIVAGLAGVIVQVLTAPSTIRTVSTLTLFAVAACLGIFYAVPEILRQWRARRSLPSDEDLSRIGAAYRVEPATSDEIGWIAGLQESVYSAEDAVPESVLREWFAVNPTGFFIVKKRDGSLAGHIDVLPLRPNTLQQFLDGSIVEREIRGDSLYPPEDRKSIKHLYVESIILRPTKGLSTAAAMIAVLSYTGKML